MTRSFYHSALPSRMLVVTLKRVCAEHYYAREPRVRSRPQWIETTLRGMPFRFETDAGVFASYGSVGRARVDPGTRLLVETMQFPSAATVCDLGCGCGVIGVVASRLARRVTLIDVNARAIELARSNLRNHGAGNAAVLQADGLRSFPAESFDAILCNPPIRAGNAVVHRLFTEAHHTLKPGGKFWMVAQTRQGAKSYLKMLVEQFGSAETAAIKGGYRILVGAK